MRLVVVIKLKSKFNAGLLAFIKSVDNINNLWQSWILSNYFKYVAENMPRIRPAKLAYLICEPIANA